MKKKISAFDFFNYMFNLLVAVIMIYPLYVVIISSFSEPSEVSAGNVYLYPVGFTLEPYINVFKESKVWLGYRNSIFYVFLGVIYDLVLTISCAYVLSKKYLPGRKFFNMFFFLTMFVSGGMIPSYLLIKNLGLLNNRLVLIIGSMSCYNMIVARSFYNSSISESLYEAAEIDGASEFQKFRIIALPLSKSIIAVVALFQAVGRWNSYMSALLYIYDREKFPLQVFLREILVTAAEKLQVVITDASSTEEAIEMAMREAEIAQTMKYSLVFISCAPLLIAYPFVQKYFVKGVMVGSIKE